MAVEGETAVKIASTFSWQDVCMTVQKGKKQEKQILSNISGSLSSGKVCALMGPSGAGKTSLLNVLAARIRTRGTTEVTGNITLDGQPITGSSLRKRIAYVMQQDILVPTQTVRESLWFSANLRLPKSYSMKDKKELVEKMLVDLGLVKCADTFIGDDMIRGVSGGEKKRTCVGIELIMKPKLIFLDEPTSGLDSYAAHNVILKLEELASKEGCNVLCTIHQPSSEVFHLFNKVMLLRSGKLFFFGGVSGLSEQLHSVNRGCPNEFNLADHVMFLLQTELEKELDSMQAKMIMETPEKAATPDVPHDKSVMTKSMEGATAGFLTQLMALTKREAQNIWRDKPGLIASIIIPVILNVFFAAIFYQVGDITLDNYDPRSHFGGMTQVAIGGMFGAAQPLLLKFPLDRGIFLREYATSTYGSAAYFLSKTMVELPQSFLNAVITWTAAYFLMGLRGQFMIYVLVFWVTGVAAASTAVLVGCLAANAEVATQAAPAVFVPQLLFAGFFITTEQIPAWLRWASYLCALKYGMNLNILNEFGPDATSSWPDVYTLNPATGIKDVPLKATVNAEFVVRNSIDPDHVWVYVGVLLAIIVVVRMLSIMALARRAAAFF
ncbi:wht-1 [Symbiodinium necroappetens]|uniref:Wht-1 protein n=1 Tax=Symbiodinium necroappetens TaxID=1628268 RepID=A0A813BB72_9DINO|nr:wht-1 [Symbiodinium necroappetens]